MADSNAILLVAGIIVLAAYKQRNRLVRDQPAFQSSWNGLGLRHRAVQASADVQYGSDEYAWRVTNTPGNWMGPAWSR